MAADAIALIGTGRVAHALGSSLHRARVPIAVVAGRNSAHAAELAQRLETRVALLPDLPHLAGRAVVAVSDAAIPEVARELAASGYTGIALHTSGALGPEALDPLPCRGVFHPLQTITGAQTNLHAISFAIDGDAAAIVWAEELADLLGGRKLRIAPEHRAAYHAAAALASNYVTALIATAVDLLTRTGISADDAVQALAPLLRASVDNAVRLGPSAALTGPVSRGDAATVAMHIATLNVDQRELYIAAARKALALARGRGLDESAAARIDNLLNG